MHFGTLLQRLCGSFFQDSGHFLDPRQRTEMCDFGLPSPLDLFELFQGVPKGRQQKGETGPGTHIFADFHWFSALSLSVNQGIRESQICAENRRKPQTFAGNRRKPQIFAETAGFSHLLSLFWRAPIVCPVDLLFCISRSLCKLVGTWPKKTARIGKDLTLYRIGKHSNPQNSPKIHQKYSKNTVFGIFGVFLPYFGCGGVCRGPSFSQGENSKLRILRRIIPGL